MAPKKPPKNPIPRPQPKGPQPGEKPQPKDSLRAQPQHKPWSTSVKSGGRGR